MPSPATRSLSPVASPSSPDPSFPINTLLPHHSLSSLPTPTSSLPGPFPTSPALGKDAPSTSNFPCTTTHPALPCQAGPGRGRGQPGTRCASTDDSVPNKINTAKLDSSGGQLSAHVQSGLSSGSLPGLVVPGFRGARKGLRSGQEPKEILLLGVKENTKNKKILVGVIG